MIGRDPAREYFPQDPRSRLPNRLAYPQVWGLSGADRTSLENRAKLGTWRTVEGRCPDPLGVDPRTIAVKPLERIEGTSIVADLERKPRSVSALAATDRTQATASGETFNGTFKSRLSIGPLARQSAIGLRSKTVVRRATTRNPCKSATFSRSFSKPFPGSSW